MSKLLIIGGATASGKTKLSLELAKRLNGEIISMDSMQIYRGMNIGTAKLKLEEMQGIPHHLIDIVQPFEQFSVANYQAMAVSVIEAIFERGKQPILVGGTGLYLDSVLYPMSFSGRYDMELRGQLNALLAENGKEYMWNMLYTMDSSRAAALSMNDTKRVIRAIEKLKNGGVEEVDYEKPRYEYTLFIPNIVREELYERINQRVDLMLEEGLVQEVEALLKSGYDKSLQSMKAIGYKEVIAYLEGEYSISECIELIKKNTRNYAKRQGTWFRKYKDAISIDFRNAELDEVIRLFQNG